MVRRTDLQADIPERRNVVMQTDHKDMLRHQARGKYAARLFFRHDSGHIAHDVGVFAQRAKERPVRRFERGEVKPGCGDGCHSYAISSRDGV